MKRRIIDQINNNGNFQFQKKHNRKLFSLLPFDFGTELNPDINFYNFFINSNGKLIIQNICNPVCNGIFSFKINQNVVNNDLNFIHCSNICTTVCNPICDEVCTNIF